MNRKAECPYCHSKNEVDFETYWDKIANDEAFVMECYNCEKLFVVEPYTSVTFHTEECKCQGVDHEYEFSEAYPRCFSKMMCKHCGEERQLTEEERLKYGVGTIQEYVEELNKKQ